MVISVTTRYQRKTVQQKRLNSGSLVGVIREQISRNFGAEGRPKKWRRNRRATIEFKENHSPRLILKPNMATGEMKKIATKGRIKTLKKGKGLVLKYVIPDRESRNPIKFSEANRPRVMLPFGNPAASPFARLERPFIYVSRQAYSKIIAMSIRQIEGIVVSIAMPVGKPGNQKLDRVIQETMDRWAQINQRT